MTAQKETQLSTAQKTPQDEPKRQMLAVVVALLALASLGIAQDRGQASAKTQERIIREVRHELLMLPYFGVFDYIAFKVDGYTVTLLGQVVRPTLSAFLKRPRRNYSHRDIVVVSFTENLP